MTGAPTTLEWVVLALCWVLVEVGKRFRAADKCRSSRANTGSSWSEDGRAAKEALIGIHGAVPNAPWLYAVFSDTSTPTTLWWFLLALPAITMLFPVSAPFLARSVRDANPLVPYDTQTVRFFVAACTTITVVMLLVLGLGLVIDSGLRLASAGALMVGYGLFLMLWATGRATDALFEVGLLGGG